MLHKESAAILAAIFAAALSAMGIATLVGRPAHLVALVTLFAGGFGSGASLVAAISARRHVRRMHEAALEACVAEGPPHQDP